jgi:HSP20 family protein
MNKKKEKKGRTLAPWRRPLSEVTSREREMEELFEDFWKRPFGRFPFSLSWPWKRGPWSEVGFTGPAVEIFEEKGDVVVKAELPGMKKEDIDVNITENFITLKGEKKKEEERKKEGYYYSECSFGSFERTIEIPREVQIDKARATFKEGVLELRLPKTEEANRKEAKIKIE